MKITLNKKTREATGLEAVFWGTVALIITGMTLLFTAAIILLTFLFITSPFWIIVLIVALIIHAI